MTNSKKLNNSSEIGIEHKCIDADLAIEKLLTVDDQYSAERDFALNVINSEPSADVQPVVHAKWIDNAHGSDFFGCSNCGLIYSYWDYDKYDYCPHCGAKMDGDEHDNR